MQKKCYITTPIYYANWAPHIGTAYTSLIADIYARIKRTIWYQVKFATGTDENGQKMKQSAAAEWKEVMEYLDNIAGMHLETWNTLQISYTDFIRTTHPTHQKYVQEILTQAYKSWDVYQWEYTWMYCVWCEAFKKESDLIEHEWEKVCEDHLKKPTHIQEKNWFFSLQKHTRNLQKFYKENQEYILPKYRYNEIKAFVDKGLEDFSISREWSDFWIPMPEIYSGKQSMVYIWFDALYNYLTVCRHPNDFTKDNNSVSGGVDDMSFWSEDCEIVHTLWKDISRFHAIYRPAMLMSSNNLVPMKEIINWFFTVDGQKMSKSLWNKIDPIETIEEVGRDALVYYLFSDIKIGNDGDFSTTRLLETRENVLKKWRWNLVSRIVKLAKKYEILWITEDDLFYMNIEKQQVLSFTKIETTTEEIKSDENSLEQLFFNISKDKVENIYNKYLESANYQELMREWFKCVQKANIYLSKKEPWVLLKSEETKEEWIRCIKYMLLYIKQLWLISSPFLIDWFARLQDIMQIQDTQRKSWKTEKNNEQLSEQFTYLLNLQTFEIQYWTWYIY